MQYKLYCHFSLRNFSQIVVGLYSWAFFRSIKFFQVVCFKEQLCIESEMECGVQSKNNRTSCVMTKAVSLVLLPPAISCIGIAECSQNQKIHV